VLSLKTGRHYKIPLYHHHRGYLTLNCVGLFVCLSVGRKVQRAHYTPSVREILDDVSSLGMMSGFLKNSQTYFPEICGNGKPRDESNDSTLGMTWIRSRSFSLNHCNEKCLTYCRGKSHCGKSPHVGEILTCGIMANSLGGGMYTLNAF